MVNHIQHGDPMQHQQEHVEITSVHLIDFRFSLLLLPEMEPAYRSHGKAGENGGEIPPLHPGYRVAGDCGPLHVNAGAD